MDTITENDDNKRYIHRMRGTTWTGETMPNRLTTRCDTFAAATLAGRP